MGNKTGIEKETIDSYCKEIEALYAGYSRLTEKDESRVHTDGKTLTFAAYRDSQIGAIIEQALDITIFVLGRDLSVPPAAKETIRIILTTLREAAAVGEITYARWQGACEDVLSASELICDRLLAGAPYYVRAASPDRITAAKKEFGIKDQYDINMPEYRAHFVQEDQK